MAFLWSLTDFHNFLMEDKAKFVLTAFENLKEIMLFVLLFAATVLVIGRRLFIDR